MVRREILEACPSCGGRCPEKVEACPCTGLRLEHLPVHGRGRIRVDHKALARVFGQKWTTEHLPDGPKATGRPGVDAAQIWRYFTTSVYASGDLPVLATRETLQNAVDAIRAAVRAHKTAAGAGRFDVTWDPKNRSLTWEDNGIGMSADTIVQKFLSIGASGKRADDEYGGQAAGGFGVAKAVILGLSPTFRWRMHTRDNLAISHGSDRDVEVFEAPFKQGTRLTIYDVGGEFDVFHDRVRGPLGMLQRLHEMLAANDLPEVTMTLNGQVVRPMFSRRGGSRVATDEGAWGTGTTATIKAHRRDAGDRRGAYYVRLKGLFQFKAPNRRGNLPADVVIDLETAVAPGSKAYPLNAARDGFSQHAGWTFSDLQQEIEKESESAARDKDDEVYDPDSDDPTLQAEARELADLTMEAFDDPEVQRAFAEASGGIADFYGEQARYRTASPPATSAAPAGSPGGIRAVRPHVLPAGMAVAASSGSALASDIEAPGDAVAVLRGILEAADDQAAEARGVAPVDRVAGSGGVLTGEVRHELDAAERSGKLDGHAMNVVNGALDRAADAAVAPGGGGLLQVAAMESSAKHALVQLAAGTKPPKRNPFGRLAGLRISRTNYDRKRAYRFRRNYGKWLPYLAVWDATLRLVAAEAQIRVKFKPGFVLDDKVLGMTAASPGKISVVYIHPDRLAQAVKAHLKRPIAIAGYLHHIAAHELTHLDGRMGQGHDEAFAAAREDLGVATAHLLPVLMLLVSRLFKPPAPRGPAVSKGPVGSDNLLDAVIGAVRNSLPPGLSRRDLDAFVRRNRPTLVGLVATGFHPR